MYKLLKMLLAFFAMFAMLVSTTSCGDDDKEDDKNEISEELSGAWLTSLYSEETGTSVNFYVYFADGFMYSAEEYDEEWYVTRCRYVYENGTLRNAKNASGCSVEVIDNRKLKLGDESDVMVFEKCNMPATFNRMIKAGEYEDLERGLF